VVGCWLAMPIDYDGGISRTNFHIADRDTVCVVDVDVEAWPV